MDAWRGPSGPGGGKQEPWPGPQPGLEPSSAKLGDGPSNPPSSNSSDQATTVGFQLPSPEDAEHKGPACAGQSGAPDRGQAASLHAPARSAGGAAPGPSSLRQQQEQQQQHGRRPQGRAVEVQAGRGALVSPALFELGALGVMPEAFRTITPFDFHMPASSIRPQHEVTNDLIRGIVAQAQDTKRQGDTEKGRERFKRWTIGSLSRYISAALQYMEACEYMLRLPQGPDRWGRRALRVG